MSEAELIKKLKSGDREVFNQIVNTHQTKVINIAYGMLSSREDAYDAAQETFLRVFNGIGAFKGGSSISTWIYRICTNVCTDMLRKRQRSGNIVSIDNDDEDAPALELVDDSPTPEQATEANERQQAVRRAISMLSDEYKAVITLYDIEGLSYDEISSVLKCPVGTIKSRLNRARNNLKKILSENRELFY